jgi:hypothetical protein
MDLIQKVEYLVVHHSGVVGDTYSRFILNHRELHDQKEPFIYHYLILGSSSPSREGEIIKGRHEKYAGGFLEDIDLVSLSVCLLGNFHIDRISPKQEDSLLSLLSEKRRKYSLPVDHVMGYSEIQGVRNDFGPGDNVDMDEIRNLLKEKV